MGFDTTHWSVVLAAGQGDTAGRAALERLCETYWYPIYGFVRRQGHDADPARDLTQSFFLSIIERGDLARVRRERGRFRSFLLASVQHFLSNERARWRRLKRGGGVVIEPLESDAELRFRREPVDARTPESAFDRQWALLLLEQALGDVRADFLKTGTAEEFDRLKPVLTGERSDEGYRALAAEFGKSEGAIKVAIHRLRRKFQQHVRRRAAETLADERDVEDELAYLFRALAG
jgi:RNA polymerase sigma-70 factor (ECF subfamily)